LLRLFPNNSAEELLVLAKIAPYLGSWNFFFFVKFSIIIL
jgi:hypothetical protein